ncbi:type II toxin-antitoxin system VapC family toxin [Deinococcus detaillensis]|uniref:Type II toxin-antitoxin system VapC family toxin n=1 Tax=Deinococcus detaillensis TaxID=2592048 RepID=A0A553V1L0_9DEIO|nr:type II toxin-antitoxin system VapC family toxin [Deinococcus detaillensis]TSA86377.1 type II toxin-antitoxin system VapC family toxin [Deinococcus detaillensis]
MIIALDTNILVDLWAATPQGQLNSSALSRLAASGHGFVVCGVVYAELHAVPTITKVALDQALLQMLISVDSSSTLKMWEETGRVHALICQRRRSAGAVSNRRPLADHLIGAHALCRTDALLTHNARDFSDFTTLNIICI